MSFDSLAGLLHSRILDPPLHPGQLASLDRFEIIGIIGSGGMGIVFLARDPQSPRHTAIKLLRQEFVNNTEARHRFIVEARHMQRMSHPSILRVIDVSDRSKGPYFIMPYIKPGSLANLIKPGVPFEAKDTRSIIRQIADAINYAHGKGIIHRDLKPANILIDQQGRVYLADFGLARRIDVNESIIDVQRSQREGTCSYMAPEVVEGKAGDTRGDIYSLGAILYEMLTGRRAYAGDNVQEVFSEILSGPPDPILKDNPNADPRLAEVAKGAMARELRDRYATAGDFLADLKRVNAGQVPVGPHEHKSVGRSFRIFKTKRTTITIACLAISSLLLLTLWMFWPLIHTRILTDNLKPVPSGITPGDAQISKTFFHDSFDTGSLNEELWEWGQTNAFSHQGLGQHQYQVSQHNGSLLIDARAKHQRGWTAIQDVWLDSKHNLTVDQSLLIEVELSARATNGKIGIFLSSGDIPKKRFDPDSVVLFEASGRPNHPLDLSRQIVRIRLSKMDDKILIQSSNGQTCFIDQPTWQNQKLRFYVSAGTSAGFPPDEVQLRLYRVDVGMTYPPCGILAKVFNVLTNRPIKHAKVFTTDEKQVATTDGQGICILALPAGQHDLRAIADGYSQVTTSIVANIKDGKMIPMNILMRKDIVEYGDALWSIPFGYKAILGIAVSNKRLYFVAIENETSTALYHMEQNGLAVTRISSLPIGCGIAFAGKELYGIDQWPGRLLKISLNGQSKMAHRLSTDWPSGLAFDGKRLWFLETDDMGNHFAAHTIDPNSGMQTTFFVSTDIHVRGIAAETKKSGGRIWISSMNGIVYEIDPTLARKTGKMESGILRSFSGWFDKLTYHNGYLWGVDNEAKRICRIFIGGTK